MVPALTGAGSSPHADIGVHTCACVHTGHTACTHVCQGVPRMHTHVPKCTMHAHTCARGCRECT